MRDGIAEDMVKHGFTLIRTGAHRIWRHPSGAQVVTSVSASDWRARKNNLSIIRRALRGLQ